MKDWIKYSIDTPVRITGNSNSHNLKVGCGFTIVDFDFCKDIGYSYYMLEDNVKFIIRSCDIEPVNPDDYYKYLKKGDYVVCIGNTSGLNYRKINTVYQITKDSAYQDCVYFGKDLNSPKVKDFRLATYSEVEKCKANNNEPTSLEEKVEEVKPSEPTIKYSEQFFVKITKEFTQELCDATEKWLVENSIAPTIRHTETFEEVLINRIEFDCYYYNQFLHNHGIDNNTQNIQKELSISELKTLIGYSEPAKEIVTEEDWKHGWYKIDDNYLHYSGDIEDCYGFWACSWGSGYTIDFSWVYEFIDTPDEALTKLFFKEAAKDYPEGTKFFPVNHESLEGESIAHGYIRGNIIWWENSIYRKGEALASRSGSGIFYYNGVWAKIESKPKVKENMEISKFEIGKLFINGFANL